MPFAHVRLSKQLSIQEHFSGPGNQGSLDVAQTPPRSQFQKEVQKAAIFAPLFCRFFRVAKVDAAGRRSLG